MVLMRRDGERPKPDLSGVISLSGFGHLHDHAIHCERRNDQPTPRGGGQLWIMHREGKTTVFRGSEEWWDRSGADMST